MADTDLRVWLEAIDAALEANDGTDRPSTLGELHRALATVDPRQNANSWKTTVAKIRRGWLPPERTAHAISVALGVPRPQLPEAAPPSVSKADLDRHLRALEAELAEQRRTQESFAEGLLARLADLEGRLALVEQRAFPQGTGEGEAK